VDKTSTLCADKSTFENSVHSAVLHSLRSFQLLLTCCPPVLRLTVALLSSFGLLASHPTKQLLFRYTSLIWHRLDGELARENPTGAHHHRLCFCHVGFPHWQVSTLRLLISSTDTRDVHVTRFQVPGKPQAAKMPPSISADDKVHDAGDIVRVESE
jgi:hypothetical protein